MDGSALMVPWPVAVLSLVYAAIATSSASTIWRVGQGQLHRAVLWPWVWCLLSAALVIGLTLLKPWARKLAVWTSVAMMAGALGVAVLAVMQVPTQPLRGLTATGLAGVHLVVIRYLTRPHVRVWFTKGTQDSRHETHALRLES